MDCCNTISSTQATDEYFSGQSARFLRKFRRKGLDKETRLLEQGILTRSVEGASLLEIGCGVGGLHLRLLQAGAAKATGIDIAQGMINGAKELSSELGLADRVNYVLGDFTDKPQDFERADIVMLDKVVCCYEEIEILLNESLQRAGTTYAIVFPRPYPISKAIMQSMIAVLRFMRVRFFPFWHNWNAMTGKILAAGFEEQYSATTIMWAVRVYRRV